MILVFFIEGKPSRLNSLFIFHASKSNRKLTYNLRPNTIPRQKEEKEKLRQSLEPKNTGKNEYKNENSLPFQCRTSSTVLSCVGRVAQQIKLERILQSISRNLIYISSKMLIKRNLSYISKSTPSQPFTKSLEQMFSPNMYALSHDPC